MDYTDISYDFAKLEMTTMFGDFRFLHLSLACQSIMLVISRQPDRLPLLYVISGGAVQHMYELMCGFDLNCIK